MPNCQFYLNHKDDTSRVGHNGQDVYCAAMDCVNYNCRNNPGVTLQFDDEGHFMRKCLTGAEIRGGVPVDRAGKKIALDTIEGIK